MPADFDDYVTLGEIADEWAARSYGRYEFPRNERLEALLRGIWLGQLGGLIYLTNPNAFFRCVRADEPIAPWSTDFSTCDRLSLLRRIPVGDPHMPFEFAEIHIDQLDRQSSMKQGTACAPLAAIRFQDYPESIRLMFERQLAVSREEVRQWDRKYGHVESQVRTPTDDVQQYQSAQVQPAPIQAKPGPRPTKSNLAIQYWHRRQKRGAIEETLAAEAAEIAKEIANDIGVSDSAGIPSESTIENAIRGDYWRVRRNRHNSAELQGTLGNAIKPIG